MCGISGIININGMPVDMEIIRRMIDIQAHRGPDDKGFFTDNKSSNYPTVGLGHCRLAILDLSAAGHQPMSYSDNRYWIVYNGEIYNYIELRQELKNSGYQFRSSCDTEVILAAYTKWGPDCLNRFNGMWAFAIWDAQKRELFCARDRFGVKPFYYYSNEKVFIFASEIKAMLVHPEVPRTINDAVVLDYLLSGNIDHIEGESFFADIRQLPPAHYLTIKNKRVEIKRYWNIDIKTDKLPVNDDLVDKCRDMIKDSVNLRLRSDVVVGGTLSGGIDSTTITCLIDKFFSKDDYHVFSAQFAGNAFDETRYVKDVIAGASHLKLHMATPSCREFVGDLPKLIWHQDEPFGDTSIYAHYRLMRMARDTGVKVILTGQGSDEIFGGYQSYYNAFLGQLLMYNHFICLSREIGARKKISGLSAFNLFKSALYHALPPRLRTKIQSFVLYKNSRWVKEEFKSRINRKRFNSVPDKWLPFDWYLYESLSKWSIPHLVHYDDRNSMAFGVESRAPYLDYRLVQLLFSTVDAAKIHNGRTKVLLRCASKGIIPDSVTARSDKIGFYTPMEEWLTQAKDFVSDILGSGFARKNPYFDSGQVNMMARRLFEGERSFGEPVWRALSLCLWHKVMLDSNS